VIPKPELQVVQPLQVQEQAARFATTREEREHQAAHIRRNGHASAISLMGQGTPGRAYAVVMRTFLHQIRTLGLSYAGIPGRPYDEMGNLP